MLRIVLCAFRTARVADLRAKRAESRGEFAAAGHESHRQRTDVRAITIQLDTASHHFHVLLAQAFGRAVFARDHACYAGVDTTLIFFVWHN